LTAAVSSLAVLLFPAVASAATTVVRPDNLNGWDPTQSGGSSTSFVEGPSTPPLGLGSVEFRVDSSGSTSAQMRNDTYDGLKLADITALSYWTYIQNFNDEQAPYIILNVDLDGNGSTDTLLFFEPVYQDATFCSNDQGNVVLNTWQDWDALNGCWWSTTGLAGAGPGTDVKTLAQILAVAPNAAIANSTNPAGAVRIVTGFGGPSDWGNFVGNADAFTLNSTTYDFEPLVGPPTKREECKNDGYKRFNNPSFKNQGQCIGYVEKHDVKIKGNNVQYNAGGLDRKAEFHASHANNDGRFRYDDANGDWYIVRISEVNNDGNFGWFAGEVVSASNPAWVGNWLFAKVEDNAPDKIWGDFTDQATAENGVRNKLTPGSGPFNVTKGNIKVQ
jgi:hypothetical protein